MYMTSTLLVGLACATTGDEANRTNSRTVFVENGVPKNVRKIGDSTLATGYIEISDKKSLLYAGCSIGRNDFYLRAKLTIPSETDRPNFVIGTTKAGISGFQRLTSDLLPPDVHAHQQMTISPDWATPGVPFRFEVIRKGLRVVITVDGTAVKHFLFGGVLTDVGFCSYDGALRIHDFYVRGETIPAD